MDEKAVQMLEYLAEKGYALEDVINMIKDVINMSKRIPVSEDTTAKPAASAQNIEVRVSNLLREMGVPVHIKGYGYLRFAIILTYESKRPIENITKKLYPAVAKEFQTTTSRVERAIRHAIECAWDRCDLDDLRQIVGNTVSPKRGKLTNGELIALLADRLHMEDKQ